MNKSISKFFLSTLLFLGLSTVAMSETYVIDVRTPTEYSSEHIKDALNIEYQNIITGVTAAKISKEDTILLYCRSGHRAGLAKQTLEESGYSHVVNLGGLEDAKVQLRSK